MPRCLQGRLKMDEVQLRMRQMMAEIGADAEPNPDRDESLRGAGILRFGDVVDCMEFLQSGKVLRAGIRARRPAAGRLEPA